MVKKIFQFLLCLAVYMVVFMAVNAALPYSRGFSELKASGGNSLSLLFMLINSAWICFTMYFITAHASVNGSRLFLNLVIVVFAISSFIAQIETFVFGTVFPVLTKPDILLIMLSSLLSIAAAGFLTVLFFQDKNAGGYEWEFSIKTILKKLGITGLIYPCLYFLFGYFIAWRFEELRLFYSGSAADDIANSYAATILNSQALLFVFQIFRGLLFGVFVLPLRKMIKSKNAFIISVCLVYLCTAVQLVIPNVLFPDMVRYAHLIEMTSSMLLFGLITGFVMWGSDTAKK